MTNEEGLALMERLDAMDEEQKETMRKIIRITLAALESDIGCAVLIADTLGVGVMTMHIMGNAAIVSPLMSAAADALKKINTHAGELH